MNLKKATDDEKLRLCRLYFFVGIALLPFCWLVNGIWFFEQAFLRKPAFPQQQSIKKFVIMSLVGCAIWTAIFITWIAIFQTNRVAWGAVDAYPSDPEPSDVAAPMVEQYVPSSPFLGYQGYFDGGGSSNTISNNVQLPSTSYVVEQLPMSAVVLVEQNNNNSSSLPSVRQQETDINELAKNLATINNAIRELQEKLEAHKNQFGELTTEAKYNSEKFTKRQQHVFSTNDNGGDVLVSYKPTPIDELEKRNKPKVQSSSDDGELSSLVDDFVGACSSSTETNVVLAKINEKKRKSVTTFDLFGDDDSNSNKTPPKKERKKEKLARQNSSSKSTPTHKIVEVPLFADETTTTPSLPPLKKSKIDFSVEESQKKKGGEKTTTTTTPFGSDFSKKRLAHSASSSDKDKTAALRRIGGERSRSQTSFLTPHEQLKMRFEQMQKQKEELMKKSTTSTSESSSKATSSKRKSDVKNAGDGLEKGEKRVAHVPLRSTLQRPVIAVEIGSKVPTAFRQRYLNLFIDECLKFAKSEDEAFKIGLEEEKTVYTKASSKTGYLNSCVNAIKRLRDEKNLKSPFDGFVDEDQSASSKGSRQIVSHESVIGGKQAASCSYSVKRTSASSAEITGQDFYDRLLPFVLTQEQLNDNGYPRCDPEFPRRATYKKNNSAKIYVDDEETKRCCCRCGKFFQIDVNGVYLSSGDCCYHWGRSWKRKISGVVESRYTCCSGDLNSRGCCIGKNHVTDMMPKSCLNNYIQTQTSYGFEASTYALDCEMVYTTGGTELARVTVVDERLNAVYDRIVKPECSLLDCNTRFSGLTETDLKNADHKLTDVQEDLMKLFCAETILIGHSLESDLRALRIIHDKVVDTSIVFPHQLGGSYKRALKNLMGEYLQKIIQDDVEGHDSKEDASACMQLMKWKIQNQKK